MVGQKLGLRDTKLAHLKFLKEELLPACQGNEIIYTEACIELLETDLNLTKESAIFDVDEKLVRRLEDMFTNKESVVLSLIIKNKMVKPSQIQQKTNINRPNAYSILGKLAKCGCIIKVNTDTICYALSEEPMKHLISEKKKKIKTLNELAEFIESERH